MPPGKYCAMAHTMQPTDSIEQGGVADSVAGGSSPVESPSGDRSKRRRRAPTAFADSSMDNEQLRLLQVALENSRAESTAADVHIEAAPTFHTTLEEFQDPIKYISR